MTSRATRSAQQLAERCTSIDDPNDAAGRNALDRVGRGLQQLQCIGRVQLRSLFEEQGDHSGDMRGGERASRDKLIGCSRSGGENVYSGRRERRPGAAGEALCDPSTGIARYDRDDRR